MERILKLAFQEYRKLRAKSEEELEKIHFVSRKLEGDERTEHQIILDMKNQAFKVLTPLRHADDWIEAIHDLLEKLEEE